MEGLGPRELNRYKRILANDGPVAAQQYAQSRLGQKSPFDLAYASLGPKQQNRARRIRNEQGAQAALEYAISKGAPAPAPVPAPAAPQQVAPIPRPTPAPAPTPAPIPPPMPVTESPQVSEPAAIAAPPVDVSTPEAAINSQREQNNYYTQQQELINRIREETPYGGAEYVRNPDGSVTYRQFLSEAEQQKLDAQNRFQSTLNPALQKQLEAAIGNFSQPYELPQNNAFLDFDNLQSERARVEDAAYKRLTQGFDEQYRNQQRDLEQRLINQGLRPGTAAYDAQMRRFEQGRNQNFESARLAATEVGSREFQNLYDIGSRDRQRAIDEFNLTRNAPLEQLGALSGFQSGIREPNVRGAQNVDVQNTDVAGTGLQYRNFAEGQEQFKANFYENVRQNNLAEKWRQKEFNRQGRQNKWGRKVDKFNMAQANRGRGGGGASAPALSLPQPGPYDYNTSLTGPLPNQKPKQNGSKGAMSNIGGAFAQGLGDTLGNEWFA